MLEWFIPEFYLNKQVSILDLKSEEATFYGIVYDLKDFREKVTEERKIRSEYMGRVLNNYLNDKV